MAEVVAPHESVTSERDPLGTRHQLANLAMMAVGLDASPHVILAIRVLALSGLYVGDLLGSLLIEVRQTREQAARRPPKRADR